MIKQPGQKEKDGVINSLVVDAREGMLYYLSDFSSKSTLFGMETDGKTQPREIIKSHQNAVRITMDGKYNSKPRQLASDPHNVK